MKIQDLMINDLVEWMGNKCKVDLPLLMTEYQDNVDSEFVKPIPLTEEILEKNGFKQGEFINDYILDDATFYLVEFNHSYLYEESDIEINYVHELQHLLRLCGLNELANNFKI